MPLALDRPLRVARVSPERELSFVCTSVGLVAAGGARRVTHVGLEHAVVILAEAQAFGRARGVVVRAQPVTGRVDLVVEPIG